MSKSAHTYPRPQLVRENWTSLDGAWQFAIDPEARWTHPGQFRAQTTIRVPFAPETPLSGVGDTGLYRAVWYRRTFTPPRLQAGQRLILHFGAVDYRAEVWVNDRLAVRHEGGYTPFCADITDLLSGRAKQTIVVRAEDDPADMCKPRGKQDWQPEPHVCWYPRTTGIWQSVWMEVVGATRIADIHWSSDVPRWRINMHVKLAGVRADGMSLGVKLKHASRVLAEDRFSVQGGEVIRGIGLSDPGLYDARWRLLWSPWSPKLIDAELELYDSAGRVIDRVTSYTAMRQVSLRGGRFLINDCAMRLEMALDQGYWPDGGLTAPDDDALRRDVELAKAMGFNGVRKHQKIENPRFLYWADVLGLVVWEEMPAAYSFGPTSVQRFTRQWTEAILRDRSHPCIAAWVPINESWGVSDLEDSAPQRHFVEGLVHLTKALDPTRPVIGNDGWEVVGDIISLHDYDSSPQAISARYAGMPESIPGILRRVRPGGRRATLESFLYRDQPVVLSEFGGIGLSRDANRTWGYSRASGAADFAARYAAIVAAVRDLPGLAGFCYTQLTDCYQEANGLLYMDRTPKFPVNEIAVATRGARNDADRRLMKRWQRRLDPA